MEMLSDLFLGCCERVLVLVLEAVGGDGGYWMWVEWVVEGICIRICVNVGVGVGL